MHPSIHPSMAGLLRDGAGIWILRVAPLGIIVSIREFCHSALWRREASRKEWTGGEENRMNESLT